MSGDRSPPGGSSPAPESSGAGGEPRGTANEKTGAAPARRMLLVDCDMFFVQVARLEDPDGVGREKLVLVGGSPTGRGVVTSASYEARAFGVRSAMPTAQALRLCPDAVVVPVPRGACQRRSRAVHTVLRALAPVVQPASIDEFYLDLGGTERLFGDETLEETARRVRATALERTEVSVSVGGGTSRLIAKLAVRRAKPAGVRVVPPGSEQAFLLEHALSDLPGVGPSLADALARRGLVSVADALPVDLVWLERWFGEGRGRWLFDRIRGVDRSRIRGHEPRKSISSERTFFQDIHDDSELERQLFRLAASVAHTLRGKGLRARTITVKVRDDDFTTRQASHTLPEPVESDAAVLTVARTLLEDLRRKRRRGVRLLGVGLSTLIEGDAPFQLALFEGEGEAETERDRALSRMMDDLRDRFGDDSVQPARILEREGP